MVVAIGSAFLLLLYSINTHAPCVLMPPPKHAEASTHECFRVCSNPPVGSCLSAFCWHAAPTCDVARIPEGKDMCINSLSLV